MRYSFIMSPADQFPADQLPDQLPDQPQRHHDPLAVRTVFVAPRRAGRPIETGIDATAAGGLPRDCPFCRGNESLTPPSILQMPEAAASAWHARIIPNRYPVVEETAQTPSAAGAADAHASPAHGVHDVVIESATHERSILAIDPARWRDVWELCRRRLAMLADRSDLAWGMVFKNSGPAAGASLEHLHSQLVALDFVPPVMAAELSAAAAAPDAFTGLIAAAEREGRIVAAADDLVAVVPHAIRQPFETWILPRTPEPWFHATSPGRVAALAELTRDLISRLDRLAPTADYNWWLHQAPFPSHGRPAANWHWHLEILPRLSDFAGFELATGCHVSVATPQESARLLREG
jgi:UDPglucose--hexose-1-phosphate uridylyltransferase